MKRIVVACGSGVATSQTVASKINSMLEDEGIKATPNVSPEINALLNFIFIINPIIIIIIGKKIAAPNPKI